MKYIKPFFESKKKKTKHRSLEINGFQVYQGRDAETNEYVTFELASDNDYWFHAKGVPGSHVVLKVGDEEPDVDTIKEVAKLSAEKSKAKSGDVEVVYCRRKYVTKEPNSAMGKVVVDYSGSEYIKVIK